MTDKTEKPTRHFLKKAWQKGVFPFSVELNRSLLFLTAILLLKFFAGTFYERIKDLFSQISSVAPIENALFDVFFPFYFPVAAIGFLLMVASVFLRFFQGGKIWSAARFNMRRNSRCPTPIFFNLVKLLAICLIGLFSWLNLAFPLFSTPEEKLIIFVNHVWWMLLSVSITLILLSCSDIMYQRMSYQRKLRMSYREIVLEKRETEGDPAIRVRMHKR